MPPARGRGLALLHFTSATQISWSGRSSTAAFSAALDPGHRDPCILQNPPPSISASVPPNNRDHPAAHLAAHLRACCSVSPPGAMTHPQTRHGSGSGTRFLGDGETKIAAQRGSSVAPAVARYLNLLDVVVVTYTSLFCSSVDTAWPAVGLLLLWSGGPGGGQLMMVRCLNSSSQCNDVTMAQSVQYSATSHPVMICDVMI